MCGTAGVVLYLFWSRLPVCCIPRFLARSGTAQQEVHARTPSSKAFVSRHFAQAACWIHIKGMRAWSRCFVRMLCSANEICNAFIMLLIIGVWTVFGKVVNDFSFHFSLKITQEISPYRCWLVHCCTQSGRSFFWLPVSHWRMCRGKGLSVYLADRAPPPHWQPPDLKSPYYKRRTKEDQKKIRVDL